MAATAKHVLPTGSIAQQALADGSPSERKSVPRRPAQLHYTNQGSNETVGPGEEDEGSATTRAASLSPSSPTSPAIDNHTEKNLDDLEEDEWWAAEPAVGDGLGEIVERESDDDEEAQAQADDSAGQLFDWDEDEKDNLSWGENEDGERSMAGLELEFEEAGFLEEDQVETKAEGRELLG